MALTDQLTAIGNAIRAKTGGSALIPLNDMPSEIASIPGGNLPAEALTITGNCNYRFAYNGWNWFITQYGNQVTTSNITSTQDMFMNITINVPFDIHVNSTTINNLFHSYKGTITPKVYLDSQNKNISFREVYSDCTATTLGNIIGSNIVPTSMAGMFSSCRNITEFPVSFLTSLDYTYIHNTTNNELSKIIYSNYNLRSVPKSLINTFYNKTTTPMSHFLYGLGYLCYVLDELEGIYTLDNISLTSNVFTLAFQQTSRIKKIKFQIDENNNIPLVRNWKNQVIDLSNNVGYAQNVNTIINNTLLTVATQVTDATSYNSLKNDPDWWTADIAYSRYNHDSAVETINSLPDTSAYIAQQGGTNTIKFKGTAGSATDGGAINDLTTAEIAVATAKGWTVTLT